MNKVIISILIFELLCGLLVVHQPLIFPFLMLIPIVLLFCVDIEKGLIFFFIMMALEGLIKRITNYHPAVYLLKDSMLILLYFTWFARYVIKKDYKYIHTPLTIPILLFIALGIIEIFNPHQISYVVGLTGIRTRYLTIPLFFFAYYFITTQKEVFKFIHLFIILGIICGIGAIVEVLLGLEFMSKLGPGFLPRGAQPYISPITGKIILRPSSIAQDAPACACYVHIVIFLILALLIIKGKVINKIWLFMLLLTSFVALLMIGVRTMYLSVAFGLLYFGLCAKRKLPHFILIMAIIVTLGLVVASKVSRGVSTQRLAMISYNQDQIGWQCRINSLKAIVPEIIEKPFGVGIGRANPGARFLVQWYPGFQPTGYHNYFTILAHEKSIIGVILMLWILKVIFFNGYKIYTNLQDLKLKYIALGILSCLFGIFFLFFAGPIMDVSPANIYFWFLAGILLKLPKIER